MIEVDAEIGRASSMRYRAIGDETVVILQHSAEVLVLNEIGGRILDLLEKPSTVSELVTALEKEYDVDKATLQIDLVDYIEGLLVDGAVELRS